ncbi:MAG: response regulator [Bacteroidia bacterium]|nr:response regulator [Bacteroidia bacterium]
MALPTPKILIAEDEEVNVMIAQHILKKLGFETVAVENGEKAVKEVQKEQFLLILMDVEMPFMDGLEATSIIRKHPNGKQTPIIALTAHSLPEKIAQIKAAGMDDVLIKPFEENSFRPILEKYISRT